MAFFQSFGVFCVISLIMLAIAFFAFTIWMLVDCIQRKEEDFKDRILWIVLFVVGLCFGYFGIISIVYYFAVKKQLDNNR